ncbi:hypothetical protein AVEN_19698-1 [Araneus ventricosus]|uniref:Uncharacterized protein n=1 Tax=Araneus ventricosus TaxID=182803 RepID=A0A4Y2C3H2_ARAVE|nr:hypothetical protein AVEN_19698-1 [Araneus ventricosus]
MPLNSTIRDDSRIGRQNGSWTGKDESLTERDECWTRRNESSTTRDESRIGKENGSWTGENGAGSRKNERPNPSWQRSDESSRRKSSGMNQGSR